MVHQRKRLVQQILLPPICVLCSAQGQRDVDLCTACAGDLVANTGACWSCAEFLVGHAANPVCGACLRRAPRYDSTHCAYRYGYPVDHLVRALKYHDRITYARVLGELLADSLGAARAAPWPQLLLPVPLAVGRYRERGFNQAAELGAQLERRLSIPLRADLLQRVRETREQAGLDRIGRRKNVRNAFELCQPLPAKHLAIVDDVVTTGSTVNEIARVLKRAGAKRIEVWAVARASR